MVSAAGCPSFFTCQIIWGKKRCKKVLQSQHSLILISGLGQLLDGKKESSSERNAPIPCHPLPPLGSMGCPGCTRTCSSWSAWKATQRPHLMQGQTSPSSGTPSLAMGLVLPVKGGLSTWHS